MKSYPKKPSLAAQRLRLAISVAQRRRHGLAATTVSPRRQSIASPRRIHPSPSTLLRRKVSSHSNAPSTSRSQPSVQSPSPPQDTITASRRLRDTTSPSVRGGSQYSGSRGRGIHRGTKRDRVTRNLPTPPHSRSPIADFSRVFEATEEVQGGSQDRYQYEENVDPETARYVWEERAKLRFSGFWVNVRKNCIKKTGSTNPADWRLVCPEFVNEEDWDGILASWMTEKWKKRSAAGVANRKKVPGDEDGSYVRHTGGCVSFEIHRTRLESELGIEMTDIEFFEKLHKKDKGKGTWCDLRAERAAAKYREIVMKKNGVDNLAKIPFDDEAWAEATSFTKNNKGYGFGRTKQAERICKKAKRTKRLRAYNSRSDEAWIEAEVASRVEKRMESFMVEMHQKVQEQVQVQVEEQVKKFLAGLQNQAPTYW